jgi:hypothetical protein
MGAIALYYVDLYREILAPPKPGARLKILAPPPEVGSCGERAQQSNR